MARARCSRRPNVRFDLADESSCASTPDVPFCVEARMVTGVVLARRSVPFRGCRTCRLCVCQGAGSVMTGARRTPCSAQTPSQFADLHGILLSGQSHRWQAETRLLPKRCSVVSLISKRRELAGPKERPATHRLRGSCRSQARISISFAFLLESRDRCELRTHNEHSKIFISGPPGPRSRHGIKSSVPLRSNSSSQLRQQLQKV